MAGCGGAYGPPCHGPPADQPPSLPASRLNACFQIPTSCFQNAACKGSLQAFFSKPNKQKAPFTM
jgi:hypothetical protein